MPSKTSNTVIDMRSRPAFLHDFYGATPGTPSYEVVKWLNRRVGSHEDEHFTRSATLDGFIDEIRDSDISMAVVVGRETPGVSHSNDEIHKMVKGHRELVGVGSVDPYARGVRGSIAEVERAVGKLGLKAINLEPGFCNPPRHCDDPMLFPVYDACEQLGVPVCLMSGPTSPSLSLSDPTHVGHVARAFPKLQIVCYHGFWPHVQEMVGVAFRYENVSVVADMYIFMPGGRLYVEAANGFMKEQLMFGSSYPFRAMKQSVADYRELGLRPEVLECVMYRNAERVLKLGA
ncbi:amidohydrolase family protein [uncultured Azohydromonas sp.]|jgi:Predicted metal-dependent hydrolase of the TIM-barrel fold|uniref:amidohydrolase family protein n=1 Tax=uncultured Azohydromonas sp. TaxID=487342 RepID=UPI00261ADE69|nr:amidohydrolase family protein [uncultured Azohydromonas sp.]